MNNLIKSILPLENTETIGISDIKPSIWSGLTYDEFSYYFDQLNLTQHELNIELCGAGYDRTLVAENGKVIRYGNALISESNELLDSTPWKHWKGDSGKCDISNIGTELIDYLHFLPSLLAVYLKHKNPNKDLGLNVALSKEYNLVKIIAWNILNSDDYPHDDDIQKMTHTILSVNSILGGLCNLTPIFNKDIDSYLVANDDPLVNHIAYLISVAFGLTYKNHMCILNSSMESIWSEYVVKNTLNSFRKNNGYREGTYMKMWGGVEDNEVAKAIMVDNPKLTKNELYKELSFIYKVAKGE